MPPDMPTTCSDVQNITNYSCRVCRAIRRIRICRDGYGQRRRRVVALGDL
jgi:hypothetical protein